MPSPKRATRRGPKVIPVAGALQALDPWAEGMDHLRSLDPRWEAIIAAVGPCRLQIRPDRFGTLVRAIIGQQISSRAASTIDGRLRALAGEPYLPGPLLAIGEEGLRGVGLSGVKSRYVLNLARAVHEGSIPLDEVHAWEDEKVIAALTTIKGVGSWTAEMFLIFGLGRVDVLSVGDLGIRVGLMRFFGLAEQPGPHQCRELTEPWRPYRTIAMWYLWRRIDGPKKS